MDRALIRDLGNVRGPQGDKSLNNVELKGESMFSREQVQQFTAMILGVVAIALRQIRWVGPYLATMVTDPAFEAFIVDRVMAILEKFGETPPDTAAAVLASVEGYAADAVSANVVQKHAEQIEQALTAGGMK